MDTVLSKFTLSQKHQCFFTAWHVLGVALVIAALILAVWIAHLLVPVNDDWRLFQHATIELISGRTPYDHRGFYNPPWTLIPLIPFAMLPEVWGQAILSVANVVAFGFLAYKLGAKTLVVLLVILSAPVRIGAQLGQIDWLASLGVIMPPQIGLFFVLMKPQACGAIALLWMLEAWQKGKAKETVRVFAPVAAAALLSFILYGFWPARAGRLPGVRWDTALWPAGVPIGLAMLAAGLKSKRRGLVFAASPFLSPYVGPGTWAVASLGLLPLQFETVAVLVGIWLMRLIPG